MSQRSTPGSAPIDPRGFCGAHFPWPLISDLVDGDDVTAVYLVLESRRAETKASKPYLKLVLGDRTGTVDAMVWDDVDRWEPACIVEAVVGVRGRVGSFQDRLQLRVQSVERLTTSGEDLEYLLPASPRDRREMDRELDEMIASVRDPGFRHLLEKCLGSESELGRAFRTHPAAKRNHHAYLSGLLEHSLSVAAACDRLAQHYAATGTALDRDLLVTAALLHDIGKLKELKGFPGVVYTTPGQLLGHIVMGIQMVTEQAAGLGEIPEDRMLLLQHLIASHQGRPEWDSPKVPQMLEALVLHYADDLDAKMNQAGALLQGVDEGSWSAYDRSFGRSFLRPAIPADSAAVGEIPANREPAAEAGQRKLEGPRGRRVRETSGSDVHDEDLRGSDGDAADRSTIDLFR